MPRAMRYSVTTEMTVTVKADDGTLERFTVQGASRGSTYEEGLIPAVQESVNIAIAKAASHANAVLEHETERLK